MREHFCKCGLDWNVPRAVLRLSRVSITARSYDALRGHAILCFVVAAITRLAELLWVSIMTGSHKLRVNAILQFQVQLHARNIACQVHSVEDFLGVRDDRQFSVHCIACGTDLLRVSIIARSHALRSYAIPQLDRTSIARKHYVDGVGFCI